MRILIAEDELVTRKILERILTANGYEVLEAADGEEAWRIFSQQGERIGIVLIDWVMPKMNGMELCRRIREKAGGYVYLIFLSSKGKRKDIVEALEAGADDYLTKPFNPKELLSRVRVGARIIELQRALKEANRKLEALAITDELTGVLNRRALLDRLKEELTAAVREGHTLCVIMIDVDRFKRINDTYGHLIGDKALVELSRRIKSQLRGYDIVGRYGGEEFLIIISKADLCTGKKIAERIRVAVSETPFDCDGKSFRLTISLGVSCVRLPINAQIAGEMKELLKKVDEALYEAKRRGRNQVVVSSKGEGDEGINR